MNSDAQLRSITEYIYPSDKNSSELIPSKQYGEDTNEKELTIKQLIKRTYLKIMWHSSISDTFYIVPALLSSVSGINMRKMSIALLYFFSVSSWIYLLHHLIFIIVINIRRLLTEIQTEMNMVLS